ncbi:MAG: hypothetical protein C9356_15795 [Oleiphilus sp.]|nr:MAG: hypothetical protein C9356_15795 [Oleiphilus sp.]
MPSLLLHMCFWDLLRIWRSFKLPIIIGILVSSAILAVSYASHPLLLGKTESVTTIATEAKTETSTKLDLRMINCDREVRQAFKQHFNVLVFQDASLRLECMKGAEPHVLSYKQATDVMALHQQGSLVLDNQLSLALVKPLKIQRAAAEYGLASPTMMVFIVLLTPILIAVFKAVRFTLYDEKQLGITEELVGARIPPPIYRLSKLVTALIVTITSTIILLLCCVAVFASILTFAYSQSPHMQVEFAGIVQGYGNPLAAFIVFIWDQFLVTIVLPLSAATLLSAIAYSAICLRYYAQRSTYGTFHHLGELITGCIPVACIAVYLIVPADIVSLIPAANLLWYLEHLMQHSAPSNAFTIVTLSNLLLCLAVVVHFFYNTRSVVESSH